MSGSTNEQGVTGQRRGPSGIKQHRRQRAAIPIARLGLPELKSISIIAPYLVDLCIRNGPHHEPVTNYMTVV